MQERFFKNMKLLPEKVIITENITQWMSLGGKTFSSFVLFDKRGKLFYAGTHISESVRTLFIQIHESRLNSLRFFIDVA